MKVGMVGLGNVGMPMLEQLRACAHDVTFRARRPEVIAHAASLGAVPVEGFGDRDVVIVCVFTDDQVMDVGPQVIPTMRAGATLVNHTTGSPTTAARLEEMARARGVGMLDAAFSGGAADISAGRLTLLVGGEAATLEAARPALAAYADPILHVGGVGDGQRVKLLNNAIFSAQVALVADVERAAQALGVDPVTALGAIQYCSGDSRVLRLVLSMGSSARMQEAIGRYIRKDVAVVEQVAADAGVDLGRLGLVIHGLGEGPT